MNFELDIIIVMQRILNGENGMVYIIINQISK